MDKGRVDYPRTPPGPHGSGVPTGTVAIDTYGEYGPTDLSGTTTIDPNSVSPVSTRRPGDIALDVESGEDVPTSGGSTSNTGNQGWNTMKYPDWGPDPELPYRDPDDGMFPQVRSRLGR